MPRKKTKKLTRIIEPDRIYNSIHIQKLINRVMLDGKKQLAEKIVYGGLQKAADKLKVQNPLEVFERAMKNIQPHVETRSRRVGGANYQIPYQVRGERRFMLACRWMIEAARARKGKPMAEKLALEIMDTANGESASVKKKLEVQRMAEANKAFAHFAR